MLKKNINTLEIYSQKKNNMFDCIVVGGGHAGVEAALSVARLDFKTALVTLDINNIGSMPCNPSIGGPAKGVVVREIDALGGEMGKAADATALQMKMLNTKKGPGVQCLRCQSDKIEYSHYMRDICLNTPNLTVVEEMAVKLVVEDSICKGVILSNGEKIESRTVILTTGTYLNGKILRGHTFKYEGPDGQKVAVGLSDSLRENNLEVRRFKTGTPPRIIAHTVDFSKMQIEPGTEGELAFSYSTTKFKPFEEQIKCHLIHTTPLTHQIIKDNLKESAMYGGMVEGIGPRYCPSIEDKIVKFADKERHQLFVEPESLSLDTIYIQGFSTSMPVEIQDKMVHSLPGFENCEILKYAYAIEYDCIDPLELKSNLETIKISNLFCAGQINGTSGYEEAAGQGLMAGINAALKMQNKDPLVLRRDESYIGLMIDDLITKGTNEPYRLLTSRAEYRLLLRHDNADLRLRKYGYNIGLIDEEQYKLLIEKENQIDELKELLKSTMFSFRHPINNSLKENNLPVIVDSATAYDLLKRPFVELSLIMNFVDTNKTYLKDVLEEVSIQVKYEGYIAKQEKEAREMIKLENIPLDINEDYSLIPNLALEARQKLNKVKPENIGQASRISGVNPADISVLIMYKKMRDYKND